MSYKWECSKCGKVDTLTYKAYWYRLNRGTGKCNKCSKVGGNKTSFKKGIKSWNTGLKGYGKWAKWFPKGVLNPAWAGGITSIDKLFRKTKEYIDWRNDVYKRDNWTCCECGLVGGKIHAHHIIPYSKNKNERLNVDNGVTLCVECHKNTDTYLSKVLQYGL